MGKLTIKYENDRGEWAEHTSERISYATFKEVLKNAEEQIAFDGIVKFERKEGRNIEVQRTKR